MERQQKNMSVKTAIKTVIKRVEQAVAEGDLETAQAAFSETVSALDSATTKGIIKQNSASRQKSRLAKKLNTIQPAAQEESVVA